MKRLRKIAGKTKLDKIRSEDIRMKLKQESVTSKIKKRQLNWYGHIKGMTTESQIRKVMEARRKGKRNTQKDMARRDRRKGKRDRQNNDPNECSGEGPQDMEEMGE
ncbi:hypothetical protein MML48_2g00012343 [Holotrichia oblita]|uniref:Uncharacterized protein n=1 Tax=Holotrichia oblita TaxID=644536 RepID=A0ACB9TN25_HOLOL|nr:hypothetical protein MML48_2g00012343 [Holotrichia oblita]